MSLQPDDFLPTVLLVDDDPIFAETLGRSLTRRGYAVTICNSAEAFHRYIALETPEFAVIDLRLENGTSGYCLVNALRERDPHTAIVMLTGYGSIASAVEAVKLGAINYLCKPVDVDAVVAALNGASSESVSDTAPVKEQTLSVRRLEWEHINRVLAEHNGNISGAARALNMHRRSLQRKLTKYPVKR